MDEPKAIPNSITIQITADNEQFRQALNDLAHECETEMAECPVCRSEMEAGNGFVLHDKSHGEEK